jgi:hypothetical protein
MAVVHAIAVDACEAKRLVGQPELRHSDILDRVAGSGDACSDIPRLDGHALSDDA